jgi:hypothetical protein
LDNFAGWLDCRQLARQLPRVDLMEDRDNRFMQPHFDTMNEMDVREIIVRPLLHKLGYKHGTKANIRTEVSLRYERAFLGRKKPTKDPPLAGRADYICDAIFLRPVDCRSKATLSAVVTG